jgi:hypothetical protein
MSDESDIDIDIAAASAFGSLVSLRPEFKFNGDSNNEREVKSFIKIYIEESFRYSNENNRKLMVDGLKILAKSDINRARRIFQSYHIDIRPPDDPRKIFQWALDVIKL